MIGRVVRTVGRLHPIQIAARGPNALLGRLIRDVPGAAPPEMIDRWPEASHALRSLANAERRRGADRLVRLPEGRLRDYEACCGLELGADDGAAPADWRSSVAVEPYPASVRARRIAVAARCGRRGLNRELARAARSVLLRPEVHLLGNHIVENGLALACAGAATRGGEADFWWTSGVRLLAWQLPAQFLPDGGHVERSASYHLSLTAGLLEAIELAEASGRGSPRLWRDVAGRALGWASAVRAPDGTYPLFNDASFDAGPTIPEVLALGDALGVTRLHSQLDATGWLRLEEGSACLWVDAGPDAEGWQPGHAHADGLSFELWVGGERAIVDYGVASYAVGPERTETRSTRVHNTVELDGIDSCEVWSSFRVGRRGRGRVRAVDGSGGSSKAELEHDGYAWLDGAPRHARLIDLRAGALEIRDRVIGGGPRREYASRLRFDAHAASRLRVSGGAAVTQGDGCWHALHGEAAPARVFEQRGRAQDAGVSWRVEW